MKLDIVPSQKKKKVQEPCGSPLHFIASLWTFDISWHIRHDFKDKINYKKEKEKVMIVIYCAHDISKILFSQL